MSKDEYIKKCGCSTSKELSDEQILSFFVERNDCVDNAMSAMFIKDGRILGHEIDKAEGISMLRQAFELDKVLEISYIMSEGVLKMDGTNRIGPGGYEMRLRDKWKYDLYL